MFKLLFSTLIAGLLILNPSVNAQPLLEERISNILQENCLDQSQTSISIVSLPLGKEIYAKNMLTPLLPASTLKVVTTAAALHYLGAEYRFRTEFLYRGQRIGHQIQGDLIIKGGGDPKLTTEHLWRIARQIRDSGIDTVTGNLIYDTSFFDDYDRAPAWDEQRSQRAYDAKISALSLNFNTVTVHVRPADDANHPLIVWLEPAPAYMQVVNNTRTIRHGRNTVSARRTEKDNQFEINVMGKLPLDSEEKIIRLNVLDPPRFTAESFRVLLQQAGVSVMGITQKDFAPINSKLLYYHESSALSLILKELNTYSNNFVAEQIVKTIAAEQQGTPGSHARGLRLVADFLESTGIHTQGLVLADGSGLSRQNRFTTQAMTDLLASIYPRFDIGPDFLASLRVMGSEGLNSHRLKNSPARAKVRGKTGTLRRVSTLIGYVPSYSGQLYAYALFLNNNRCGYYGADRIEDRIISTLYETSNNTHLSSYNHLLSHVPQ